MLHHTNTLKYASLPEHPYLWHAMLNTNRMDLSSHG